MRHGLALALLLISPLARADGQDAQVDGWRDFVAQDEAIENATTQDCATACKALESLARAAQHICDVAPDKCDDAKARLRAASERVHAACPQCSAATQAPPAMNDQVETVSTREAPRTGGCAGCAVASSTTRDASGALGALMALAALVRLRRRRAT